MVDQLFPPTIDEQIACVEREIAMRERVYPGWVSGGRMTQQRADREIETMRMVLATIRAASRSPASTQGGER